MAPPPFAEVSGRTFKPFMLACSADEGLVQAQIDAALASCLANFARPDLDPKDSRVVQIVVKLERQTRDSEIIASFSVVTKLPQPEGKTAMLILDAQGQLQEVADPPPVEEQAELPFAEDSTGGNA